MINTLQHIVSIEKLTFSSQAELDGFFDGLHRLLIRFSHLSVRAVVCVCVHEMADVLEWTCRKKCNVMCNCFLWRISFLMDFALELIIFLMNFSCFSDFFFNFFFSFFSFFLFFGFSCLALFIYFDISHANE